MNRGHIAIPLLALVPFLASAQDTGERQTGLPLPTKRHVDFSADIRPIIEQSCLACHGRERDKGGFRMDTRELALKGGDSGLAITIGNSAQSRLIQLVAGKESESFMPRKGNRLTPKQIGLLRAWIDQGAAWDRSVSFARNEPPNLHPRRPIPPEIEGVKLPLDRFLDAYFQRESISSPPVINDRLFARRVWLDSIGLLPPPDQLRKFLADDRPNKRELLVDRLLNDNPAYAQHWLTFWNDLLRNDYAGTGYLNNGRSQITAWLYEALATNKRHDQFIKELVDPIQYKSSGFLDGIVWRGVVTASQRPEMQASQNISQVFLGVNIKCASCHDSLINDYTLKDAYGLASVFANKPLEMHECNQATGKFSAPRFLFPQLGRIDESASLETRRRQLAEILTHTANGRTPRVIVNRLWARLLGRGLVEPVDEMDLPAWNQDVLDWLAADLVANKWNLKITLARILNSRAYQLPAVDHPEQPTGKYVFRGPGVGRLNAEQYRDALSSLTGVGYVTPTANVDFSLGAKAANPRHEQTITRPIRWIWSEPAADKGLTSGSINLRRTFSLPELPTHAVAAIAADDIFELYINSIRVLNGSNWKRPSYANLRPYLRKGRNLIAVQAVNAGSGVNSAGFIFYCRIDIAEKRFDIASDKTWLTGRAAPRWTGFAFDDHDWKPVAVLGPIDMKPWSLQTRLEATVSGAYFSGSVRAALVPSDRLARALGRPSRERVVTTRRLTATDLQALELTNGESVSRILTQGAYKLAVEHKTTPVALINQLYVHAISRAPSAQERDIAAQLIGSPVKQEGLEDFLWAIAMHPEFQLIY